jgi:hypothetical protein
MHARRIVLAVLAAVVTLTSVASAGPAAAKQRVAITAVVFGKAVLDPLQQGVLRRDAGTFGGDWSKAPDRVVMRAGQKVEIYTNTWTFTGKRGSLTFRGRNEWVDVDAGPGFNAATGTWTVVRGTGEYAQITGSGRSVHVARDAPPLLWKVRQEGLLTVP